MVILHRVSDFVDSEEPITDRPPHYYYQGYCPENGNLLKLPRTPLAEAIAQGLMKYLNRDNNYSREGKMYGILLVELPSGEQRVLKAFSGLLNGCNWIEDWVPPIPGRDRVALEEARTLAELEAIKKELITLKQLPERQQYETLLNEFELQLQKMSDRHQNCQRQRQQQRQIFCQTLSGEALEIALFQLDEESRQNGIEKRNLKRHKNQLLEPIQQLIENKNARILELKQRRKELSRQLQFQMQQAYNLTNFLGQSRSLQQLMPGGLMPTGTGDCCAPKLLHYAASHGLKPQAMAEFWWGYNTIDRDKIQGDFYEACAERCQPLMGFLLSGLQHKKTETKLETSSLLPLDCDLLNFFLSEVNVYEDEWLIAINKPADMLSVPGRDRLKQDSVLSRLRHLLPDGKLLMPVHRLDRGTSGILLLARNLQTYRQISQQFEHRQVDKTYEAVLSGSVKHDFGAIALPLWGDPSDRPYQKVDEQRGKPSLTHFRVMEKEVKGKSPFLLNYTRVEFKPLTGRTHQIRVHAADSRGLGVPILGDRLYGCSAVVSRLHLHARELRFYHPHLEKTLHLEVKTPF